MVMFQYSYLSHSQAGYPIQGTCTSWWTSRSFVSQRWSSWAWGLHGGERCVSCLYNEPRSAADGDPVPSTSFAAWWFQTLWNVYGMSMEYLWNIYDAMIWLVVYYKALWKRWELVRQLGWHSHGKRTKSGSSQHQAVWIFGSSQTKN